MLYLLIVLMMYGYHIKHRCNFIPFSSCYCEIKKSNRAKLVSVVSGKFGSPQKLVINDSYFFLEMLRKTVFFKSLAIEYSNT